MSDSINLVKYMATLKKINCNLCGENKTGLLELEQRFKTNIPIVICKKCGLIYLNPRWSDEAYANFYKEDYRTLMGESEESPEDVFSKQCIHGSRILSFCSDYIKENARIIDIGCSAGGILWTFKQVSNCQTFGIEPSIKYSQYVQNGLGIETYCGTLDAYDSQKKIYDLGIVTQTFNHMLDPLKSLQKMYTLLNEKGKLFIEVQNYPEYIKLTPKSSQVDHTYYFTPETLVCMLQKAGFKVIKMEIDTAKSADLMHPYLYKRSAKIHIRCLCIKTSTSSNPIYPNYKPIQKNIKQSIKKSRNKFLRRKIIRFLIN